jgi:hypothetical protein
MMAPPPAKVRKKCRRVFGNNFSQKIFVQNHHFPILTPTD